jgi:L-ribulose-5-phosphate 4-epimerase
LLFSHKNQTLNDTNLERVGGCLNWLFPMLEELKTQVCEANLKLVREGLVFQTFGNASAVDRLSGCMVIKPSGVPYEAMKPEHMVVVDCGTGLRMEGSLKPSSDAPTHILLYRSFQAIGGIVHTHSFSATAWAQACLEIPAFGTTQADYFAGPVPCTRRMTPEEIQGEYEKNTGSVIAERFRDLNPVAFPGILVASHGPFTWGKTVEEAVQHAAIVEYIARLASETIRLQPEAGPMQPELLQKHFLRKHGPQAYYGQK